MRTNIVFAALLLAAACGHKAAPATNTAASNSTVKSDKDSKTDESAKDKDSKTDESANEKKEKADGDKDDDDDEGAAKRK
jgi:hypothetical protein